MARSRWEWIAACGVVVAALAFVAAVQLWPDEDEPAAASSATTAAFVPVEERPFTLEGSLTLTSSDIEGSGRRCYGTDGYDDVAPGATVVVYDADGSVVATGALGVGDGDSIGSFGTTDVFVRCEFAVAVDDVPAGSDFYQVEVGSRGRITVTAEDARAGLFEATLG